ncbi:hypothetical protein UFOVP139_4 [uncultured Caudovirales phage]|uniref:Uncharacterized protein n=1 Tax=uncultured Caudovirales phage TaxID=2100421 RepID=A0A6J5LKQ2_9CAUD|nr:hypothetical protein UFOVP139_4 [uncultured Caudovirales phage]
MFIWVNKKVVELKGQTGFLDVEKELATKLLAEGYAQDPAHGANALKHLDHTSEPVALYETKVMTAKVPSKFSPKKKVVASEEGDK